MELSVSILSLKNDDNVKEKIEKLNSCQIDYLHLDIMDGQFVTNKTWNVQQIKQLIPNNNKRLDVHLMVYDVEKYINDFSLINPEFITFHFEATTNILKTINLIKEKNIKVGISIKPDTDVSVLLPYLNLVDLVLIMSVEPGQGGQQFLKNTTDRIAYLADIRKKNNYKYLIEVDGGVNNLTINYCKNCDIIVVGSYITNNNYEESISNLKQNV